MKLSLIGPSYPAFSKAVSVQQSLNLYPETVEAPEGKSKQILRGRPGITLFKDLTVLSGSATPVRGLWSGGGRLFFAAGTKFGEVDINGALVGSLSTIANDTYPVDILPNGNQLFVVSGGTTYCDNGLGLVANALAALSGKATHALGTLINWDTAPHSVTGNTDKFDIGMLSQAITLTGIAGGPFTVAKITNPNLIQVTPNPGLFSSVDWSCTPVLNATRGAFVDGYFIVNRPSSRQFNISNLLDGSTWSGLDYGYKEGYPDNLQAVFAEAPYLYLLGTETLEIYRNTGNASFPFERVDGGFARVGLSATWSPVSIMGKLHMLAGGAFGQVVAVRMEGANPVRISNHAVEEALRQAVFPYQGVSFSYIEGGHLFWVISFDTGINTWVYDATEAQYRPPQECWHERASWTGSATAEYQPRFHTYIPEWNGGTHIVGAWNTGKLYTMDADTFDDAGSDIQYIRALGYVYNEGKRIYHQRLEVELETGTAATPPTVKLDWSDDRGQTWGTGAGAGTTITMGPGVSGTYTTRYYSVALGSSRGRVYRLTITGKGRIAVIEATLEMELGTS